MKSVVTHPVSRAAKVAGRRLLAFRKAKGLSLYDVKRQTGLDASNLARYERGEGETSLRRYEQLARFYGVTLADLFAPVRRLACSCHSPKNV